LHPWQGEVACAAPRRGEWGGPPAGAEQQIATATNTAFAPRGTVQLASLIAKDVPSIGVIASNPVSPPIAKVRPQACGGCETAGGGAATFVAAGLVGLALRKRRR